MISDEKLLSIRHELEQSENLKAFILKYHHNQDAEVQYLVTLANWHEIQQEEDVAHEIILVKRFLNHYRHHSDDRVKRLVILAHSFNLQYAAEHLTTLQENEWCNEIIELSQFVDLQDAELSVAVVDAYWRKAQQLDDKDFFKTEYFYNRMILLSQNLSDLERLRYRIRAEVARILSAMRRKEDITTRVDRFFIDFPEVQDNDINQQLLKLVYAFLQCISPAHDAQLKDKITVLEHLIETDKFTQIINAATDPALVNAILQYLTYLFWVDQRLERADILVQQYFQVEDKSLQQILENNFQFPISDSIDLDAFNQYLSKHYEQYAHLSKYRKMFKVNRKNIFFK